MARDYAKTNLDIWNDPDFRALPWPAQYLYRMIWDHPALTYCGSLEWRPRKLQGLAGGWTLDHILAAADCLAARHFVVIDESTEELLIRSWIRWDGVLKNPNLAVSMRNAHAALASNTLRGVVIHELVRLRERDPDLGGWMRTAVARMLDLPTVDPRTIDLRPDPFRAGFKVAFITADGTIPSDVGGSLGGAAGGSLGGPGSPSLIDNPRGSVSPAASQAPTTAPATAPLQQHQPKRPHPSPVTPAADETEASADAEGDFDRWWELYPHKVGKIAARKAYDKASKSATAAELLDGLRRHLPMWKTTEPQFIPHASTWLNGGRWEDVPTAMSRPSSDGGNDWMRRRLPGGAS